MSVRDVFAFFLMGGLLPSVGASLLYASAWPMVAWLVGCGLFLLTETRA